MLPRASAGAGADSPLPPNAGTGTAAPSSSSSTPGTQREARKIPLIVVPHGGPHSAIPTSYIPAYAFLCVYLGAAVLQVNYRGSTGYGKDRIDSLLGRIGCNDVADMVTCTRDAIDKEPSIDGNLSAYHICLPPMPNFNSNPNLPYPTYPIHLTLLTYPPSHLTLPTYLPTHLNLPT